MGRRVSPAKSMSHWNPDPLPPVVVHARTGNGINTVCGTTTGRRTSNRDRVTCPVCLTKET